MSAADEEDLAWTLPSNIQMRGSLLPVGLSTSKQNLRGIGKYSSSLIATCHFPSPSFEPAGVAGSVERARLLHDRLRLTERVALKNTSRRLGEASDEET